MKSHQTFNFTVDHLKGSAITILSVFHDKLLISYSLCTELFIHSRYGLHLSTIKTINYAKLNDAVWSGSGSIVYAIYHGYYKVVVISESGKIIAVNNEIRDPTVFSVSTDDVLYLATERSGVFQSFDDGVSWSLAFKPTDGWLSTQFAKVTSDHSDDFWILERGGQHPIYYHHLRVYSLNKRHLVANATWRNIAPTTTDDKQIEFSGSSLSCDINNNIFVSDINIKAVHVFTENGHYDCQLLSQEHIEYAPSRLSVDNEHQILYVGQWAGVVGVYKLLYGVGND